MDPDVLGIGHWPDGSWCPGHRSLAWWFRMSWAWVTGLMDPDVLGMGHWSVGFWLRSSPLYDNCKTSPRETLGNFLNFYPTIFYLLIVALWYILWAKKLNARIPLSCLKTFLQNMFPVLVYKFYWDVCWVILIYCRLWGEFMECKKIWI